MIVTPSVPPSTIIIADGLSTAKTGAPSSVAPMINPAKQTARPMIDETLFMNERDRSQRRALQCRPPATRRGAHRISSAG
jgi:hypothetical protein